MEDRASNIARVMNLILPKKMELPVGDQFERKFMYTHGGFTVVKPNSGLSNYFRGRVSFLDPMPSEVPRAYRVWNARGEEMPPEGYRLGSTLAGYIHLHFGSNPAIPGRFFGLHTR